MNAAVDFIRRKTVITNTETQTCVPLLIYLFWCSSFVVFCLPDGQTGGSRYKYVLFLCDVDIKLNAWIIRLSGCETLPARTYTTEDKDMRSCWPPRSVTKLFVFQTIADVIRTCLGPRAMMKVRHPDHPIKKEKVNQTSSLGLNDLRKISDIIIVMIQSFRPVSGLNTALKNKRKQINRLVSLTISNRLYYCIFDITQ